MDVHPWLIEHSPELRIELCGRQTMITSGPSFGSRYVVPPTDGEVYDFLPETMTGRVRICPTLRGTGLRQVDLRCRRSPGSVLEAPRRQIPATFIDQGYCFNAGEWSFPDAPLRASLAAMTCMQVSPDAGASNPG